MDNIVSFPGLGIQFNIDPVAFTLIGKSVYWYGIIIAIGFFLAVLFCVAECKRVGINSEHIVDIALLGAPVGIICARLYYVAFNLSYYSKHPGEIFAVWLGGLAIYGGVIGSVVSTLIYCKIKKLEIPKIFDIGAMGLLIGQIVGRWGNFINKEAYGYETNLPWRMNLFIKAELKTIAVHPTFLYESLWNLLGFLMLLFYRKKKKFDGEIFLIYVAWYGLGRFLIEGLRTDSLYLMPGIRISQVLAFVSMLCAIAALFYFRLRAKNSASSIDVCSDCNADSTGIDSDCITADHTD